MNKHDLAMVALGVQFTVMVAAIALLIIFKRNGKQ